MTTDESRSAGERRPVPVELSDKPPTTDNRRVLGIVPGKPVAGERKEPAGEEMVMVILLWG